MSSDLRYVDFAISVRKPLIGTRYEPGLRRLLSYPIPLVYHDLEDVTRDIANDLHAVGIPPIVNLDDFV